MVRAIEANLEGGQFILRVTKWYDFKQEAKGFSLSFFFAQWWPDNALVESTAVDGTTGHWELYVLGKASIGLW